MRYSIGENGCSQILKGGGDSGGNEVKKRGKGKKGEREKGGLGYTQGNSDTGGTTNKKK